MSTPAPETLKAQPAVAEYFAGPPQTPTVWDKILPVKDWAKSVTPDKIKGFVKYGLDEWGTHFILRALEAASGDDEKPYTVNVDRLLTVGKPGKVEMYGFLSREVERVKKERARVDWHLKYTKQYDDPETRVQVNARLTELGQRLTEVESLEKIWADPNAKAADSERALGYLNLRQGELVHKITSIVSKLHTGGDLWNTEWEASIAAAQDYEACVGLKDQVSAKMDQDPVYREKVLQEAQYWDMRDSIELNLYRLGVSEGNIPVEYRNYDVREGVRARVETEQLRDFSTENLQKMRKVNNALSLLDDIAHATGMDFPTVQKVFGLNLRIQTLLEGYTDLRAGVTGVIERTEDEKGPVETHTLSFGYMSESKIDEDLIPTLTGKGFNIVVEGPQQGDEGFYSATFEKTYTSS